NPTNLNCFEGANGEAEVKATGGTGAYTYKWNTGATTATISNLAAGTYSVLVTDANSCTATASVTITQPPVLTLTGIGTEVKCNGEANGEVTLTATGGELPYSYSKDGVTFQASNKFENLAKGVYTFTVKDKNGCLKTTTVEIKEPNTLTATSNKVDVTCYDGKDGSVTVNPVGGNQPYTYLWSTTATTQTITGLAAGTYSVIVTDAKGCKIDVTGIVITQPDALVPEVSSNSPVCEGGTITLTANGGTSYSWAGPNGYTSSTQNPSISSATSANEGVYTVTVTNSKQCVGTATIAVTIKALPKIDPSTEIVCEGNQLKLIATDFGVDAEYKWTGPNSFSQTGREVVVTANATQANKGVYTITITKESCSTSGIVTVDVKNKVTPPSIAIDGPADICEDKPVKLVAMGCIGGQITWSTTQTGTSITVSVAGTYTATCKAGECSSDASNSIVIKKGEQPKAPVIDASKKICCDGEKATLTAIGCNGTLKWSTEET
ncbi:hypothetical protein ACFSR2_24945, partial [Emticicia soli]